MGKRKTKLVGATLEAHQITGKAGGDARSKALTSERKSEIASIAAKARWADKNRKRLTE